MTPYVQSSLLSLAPPTAQYLPHVMTPGGPGAEWNGTWHHISTTVVASAGSEPYGKGMSSQMSRERMALAPNLLPPHVTRCH